MSVKWGRWMSSPEGRDSVPSTSRFVASLNVLVLDPKGIEEESRNEVQRIPRKGRTGGGG